MSGIKQNDIENIIDELNKLSNYAQILKSPEEFFQHMQGHRTELSLVLSAFSIAENSQNIIKLLNQRSLLRSVLLDLLDVYVQHVPNACVCDEMCNDEDDGDEEEKCAYCWAKEVLKETK
jgi:hypothetical protein